MDPEAIMAYCNRQLAKMEEVVGFDRSPQWYEDQLRLRTLFVQASSAQSLASIARRLDGWNASGVPVENVGGH